MPNMRFPSREQVVALREKYPEGTKIELIEMDEEKNPPPGTIGTVIAVDDSGQLMMRWETGSTLSLIPGVDSFKVVV